MVNNCFGERPFSNMKYIPIHLARKSIEYGILKVPGL